jgi:hypothetical protein
MRIPEIFRSFSKIVHNLTFMYYTFCFNLNYLFHFVLNNARRVHFISSEPR